MGLGFIGASGVPTVFCEGSTDSFGRLSLNGCGKVGLQTLVCN